MTSRTAPALIGLGYRKRAGKDTVADYLVSQFGYTKVGMVNEMKAAVQTIFGWDERHTDGELKETVCPNWGFTPRWAMEKFGSEAMRTVFGDDIWIRVKLLSITNLLKEARPVVIKDLRYPNEALFVRALGGHVWRVDRPGLPPPGSHPTETALATFEGWDNVVNNDGTVDDLYAKIDALMQR